MADDKFDPESAPTWYPEQAARVVLDIFPEISRDLVEQYIDLQLEYLVFCGLAGYEGDEKVMAEMADWPKPEYYYLEDEANFVIELAKRRELSPISAEEADKIQVGIFNYEKEIGIIIDLN